jgi:hypothetical protein
MLYLTNYKSAAFMGKDDNMAAVQGEWGAFQITARIFRGKFVCVGDAHWSYATKPATIERIREFMKENKYRDSVGRGSKHHKIYLGDPRKADPAKLKTVLRHLIEKA